MDEDDASTGPVKVSDGKTQSTLHPDLVEAQSIVATSGASSSEPAMSAPVGGGGGNPAPAGSWSDSTSTGPVMTASRF